MTMAPARSHWCGTCLRSNMQNTNAWTGTTITFVLTPQAGGTHLDFANGY